MPGPYDFAVIGSGTLSLLLAGVLVRDHGKSVVRIGRKPSAERLPRGPDLALATATRPESWRMLRDADAETRQLLAAIGAKIDDIDVEIHADTDATRAALDHIAHLAAGYRQSARPIPGGWRFGGVSLIPPDANRLSTWLDGLGVVFVEADAAPLGSLKAGVAELDGIDAGQIVIADDAAILDLDPSVRPPMLGAETVTMTLLESAPRRSQPLRIHADRHVTTIPRDATTMLARILHDADVDTRLASVLPGPFPIRRLATARYRVLGPTDGAPVIGRMKPSRLFVVAGLGQAAAFFAPPLARFLAGTATADEKSWFAAHDPAKPRDSVVEFVP